MSARCSHTFRGLARGHQGGFTFTGVTIGLSTGEPGATGAWTFVTNLVDGFSYVLIFKPGFSEIFSR